VSTSGVCKGLAVLAVAVVVGFGSLSWKKYLKSRPQGVPPVQRVANPASPRGGFGSRPQDFADPRTTTLRHVSEWDRKQGVVGNTTVGGKR
jgi:hypothetical protein